VAARWEAIEAIAKKDDGFYAGKDGRNRYLHPEAIRASPVMADCVAKLDDNPSVRNNRIVAHKFLNQHCASASAFEAILPVLAPKIVLQHNRP
jgi:hypothetical protein